MARMRFLIVPALLLVAACSGGDVANNAAAAADGESASLAGLYMGAGEGAGRARMCVTLAAGAEPRFGMIAYGQGDTNCTMAGTLRRQGSGLRLTADPECSFDARLEGGTVTLPDQLPRGCAYYCGPDARLGGATFTRGQGDAAQAVDFAGEPLCG